MQLHLTDQQFIDRVRRSQRHRRKIGAICIVVGVAGVLTIVYMMNHLYQQSESSIDSVSHSSIPSSQSLNASLDETRYMIGFTLGFMCAEGLAGMATLAVTGLVMLVIKSRKDTLLLKCWDGRAEMGDSADDDASPRAESPPG